MKHEKTNIKYVVTSYLPRISAVQYKKDITKKIEKYFL